MNKPYPIIIKYQETKLKLSQYKYEENKVVLTHKVDFTKNKMEIGSTDHVQNKGLNSKHLLKSTSEDANTA